MSWRSMAWLAVLALAPLGGGCAQRGHRHAADVSSVTDSAIDPLPSARRTSLTPVESSSDAPPEHPEPPAGDAPPVEYQSLGERDCQCRAAGASLAKPLEEEGSLASSASDRRGAKSSVLKRDLLAEAAREERNRAASEALQLFHRLTEAEAGRDLLTESLTLVDQSLAYVQQIRDRGLKVEIDDGKLLAQRRELLDRQAQLELSLHQINDHLRRMLEIAADDRRPIWPEADLSVTPEPLDAEVAVVTGLAGRADISALQMLDRRLSAENLPAARAALSRIDGLLGIGPVAKLHLLHKRSDADVQRELATRRRQIRGLLADRRRAATDEIRHAVRQIETRLRQVSLARATWRQRRERVSDLQKKRGLEGVSAFDISAARLAVAEAQSDLVAKIIAWKIAKVKLKEAQGLLAIECGYRSPSSTEHDRQSECASGCLSCRRR